MIIILGSSQKSLEATEAFKLISATLASAHNAWGADHPRAQRPARKRLKKPKTLKSWGMQREQRMGLGGRGSGTFLFAAAVGDMVHLLSRAFGKSLIWYSVQRRIGKRGVPRYPIPIGKSMKYPYQAAAASQMSPAASPTSSWQLEGSQIGSLGVSSTTLGAKQTGCQTPVI